MYDRRLPTALCAPVKIMKTSRASYRALNGPEMINLSKSSPSNFAQGKPHKYVHTRIASFTSVVSITPFYTPRRVYTRIIYTRAAHSCVVLIFPGTANSGDRIRSTFDARWAQTRASIGKYSAPLLDFNPKSAESDILRLVALQGTKV